MSGMSFITTPLFGRRADGHTSPDIGTEDVDNEEDLFEEGVEEMKDESTAGSFVNPNVQKIQGRNKTTEKKDKARAKAVTLWDEEETGSDHPDVPMYGGLYREAARKLGERDKVFPWSGTDPDAVNIMCYTWDLDLSAWICPDSELKIGGTKIKGPTHAGMFRPLGVKEAIQTKDTCTTWPLTEKFGGVVSKSDHETLKLKAYKTLIRQFMIANGMFDVFSLQDPRNPSIVRDLFKRHGMMPQEHVATEVKRLRSFGDTHINNSLDWSGEVIRKSLSVTVLSKLLTEVQLDTSGPETWCALMRNINGDSYEALEIVKQAFLDIKLKDFPGKNIKSMNLKLEELYELLDSADRFDKELVPKLCYKYEVASDAKFSQWATTNLYEPAQKQVEDLLVMEESNLGYKVLTPTQIFKVTNTKYRTMCDAGRYTSQVTTSEKSDALPAGYTSQIMALLTQVGFDQKSRTGTTGGGTRGGGGKGGNDKGFQGDCFGCGTKGVRKADCPKCKGASTGGGDKGKATVDKYFTINGTKYEYKNYKEWSKIAPVGGQATQIKHGKTKHRFCQKCNDGNGNWMYHYTDKHDEYMAKRKAKTDAKAAGGGPVAGVAIQPATDTHDDNVWMLGGLHF